MAQQEKLLIESAANRRSFLKWSGGILVGSSLLATACKDDDDDDNVDPSNTTVNLGSGDFGILNYAYALEQLEAAFYDTLVKDSAFTTTFSDATQRRLLTDIRDHEVAHREFFKAALGTNAIKGLTPDFSSVNFKDRNSVLSTAKTFEDLGVAAYNGAAKLITDPGYLTLAGKIVSVEARHAAYIRDLISNGSFANSEVVDSNGLDRAFEPSAVLTAADPFIKEKIDASNLPTS